MKTTPDFGLKVYQQVRHDYRNNPDDQVIHPGNVKYLQTKPRRDAVG